ncbi:MAG: hypothetical protein LAT83_05595 [Kiritimatiellae bacterium]|nr:hypothetical protein [Kiritimatiellia bacterium]
MRVEATYTPPLPAGGFDYAPRIADETLKAFLPQTPELYTHDEEGNLLADGRWNYTWDANNRLHSMETRPAAWQAGVPRRQLKFSYDYMGRRFQKQVYHWNESTHDFSLHETILFHYDGWLLVREDILPADGPATTRSHVWGNDLSGTKQGAGGVGGLLMTILEDGSVHLPVMDGNGNIVAYLNANDGTPSTKLTSGTTTPPASTPSAMPATPSPTPAPPPTNSASPRPFTTAPPTSSPSNTASTARTDSPPASPSPPATPPVASHMPTTSSPSAPAPSAATAPARKTGQPVHFNILQVVDAECLSMYKS